MLQPPSHSHHPPPCSVPAPMASCYTAGRGTPPAPAPLPRPGALSWLPLAATLRDGAPVTVRQLAAADVPAAAALLRHAVTVDRAWPWEEPLDNTAFAAYWCSHAAFVVVPASGGEGGRGRGAPSHPPESSPLPPRPQPPLLTAGSSEEEGERTTLSGGAPLSSGHPAGGGRATAAAPGRPAPPVVHGDGGGGGGSGCPNSGSGGGGCAGSGTPPAGAVSPCPPLLGAFYVKPNYPGRCDHLANGGFVTAPAARRRGVGTLMAAAHARAAADLGYRGVVFNLVFANNAAATALWERVGMRRVGTIPAAARMRPVGGVGEEVSYVDAHILYRSLV